MYIRTFGRWLLTGGFLGFLTVTSFLVGRYVIGPPIKRTLSPVREPPPGPRFSPPEPDASVEIRELPGLPKEPIVKITPSPPPRRAKRVEERVPERPRRPVEERPQEEFVLTPTEEFGEEGRAFTEAPLPPSPQPSVVEEGVTPGASEASPPPQREERAESRPGRKPSELRIKPPSEKPVIQKRPKEERLPTFPKEPEGVKPVERQVKATQPSPTAPSEERPRPYRVQVAAFQNRENAKKIAAELFSKGYYPKIVHQEGLFRVQVGAFDTKEEANNLANELKGQGYSVVVTP